VLGWRPDEIRRATIPDLLACFDGWVASQGGGDGAKQKYPTLDDMAELNAHKRKMAAKRRERGQVDG
jgi:hypothetical protein